MLTDPIADFLNRLQNASNARRKTVSVRASGMIRAIAQLLMQKRFVEHVELVEEAKGMPTLTVTLRTDREPLEMKRVSKPGQRIYVGHDDIKRVKSGLGMGIISTSQGLLSDQEARVKKVGGEYIAQVY